MEQKFKLPVEVEGCDEGDVYMCDKDGKYNVVDAEGDLIATTNNFPTAELIAKTLNDGKTMDDIVNVSFTT